MNAQAKAKAQLPPPRAEAIRNVGVIGAGQMGNGIAHVVALAGYSVALNDLSKERVDAALANIERNLSRQVTRGAVKEADMKEALKRISYAPSIADLAQCDLVIEAATEDEQVKRKIFAEICPKLKPEALLASNTSSISITRLASATDRPERFIGMHFMNPVPVMKLVEVIRALPTDDETYGTAIELARRFGKEVVTAKDIPGFIVNRLLIPFLNEACFALQEGLGTVEDIDKGIKLGLNHPMGPFELADLIGLDTCLAISEVLQRELGEDKYRPAPLLRQYVAAGWLGRKSGRGFHRY